MKYLTNYSLILLLLCSSLLLKAQECERQSTFPTLCITTDGGAQITSKDSYVRGDLNILADAGTPGAYSGRIRIRGRGNSTWELAKKPYRINLDVSSSLLGLPANAKNWVLLANHADKTLIRNSVAFEISSRLGLPFTCAYRHVDVVLNGQYVGSYLLTDHIEIGEHRVDVDELSSSQEDMSEPNITGGYVAEIDGFAPYEPGLIETNRKIPLSLKSPEGNATQTNYFINYINAFENRLFSNTPSEAPGGYFEMVDKESLVNWYIACELTGNSDSFWSVRFFKRRGNNRFFLGPLWDFDIAFNSDNRVANAGYRLMSDAGHSILLKQWIARHRQDDVFMRAVKVRWNELMADGLESFILGKVDELSQALVSSGSAAKNYTRWNVLNERVLREVFYQGTYGEHVSFLRQYLEDRIQWFDKEINGIGSDSYYKISNLTTGLTLSAEATGSNIVTQQASVNNEEKQVWQLKKLDNTFYRIYHTASGKYLGALSTDDASQTPELVDDDASSPLQHWRITQVDNSSYAIISRNERQGLESRTLPGTAGTGIRMRIVNNSGQGHYFETWMTNGQGVKWQFTLVDSPLPVTLSRFTASRDEQGAKLDWAVSEVSDFAYFEVERLNGGRIGVPLGRVESRGVGAYTWTDNAPKEGVNYYRLKMVDVDGSYDYSRIVSLEIIRGQAVAFVYPNPVEREIRISTDELSSEDLEVFIYNMNGNQVLYEKMTISGNSETLNIPVPGLAEGVYQLRIRDSVKDSKFRFVKAAE